MRQPLGQHFLRDARVLKTILAAAELAPGETALEIGPGQGALTALVAGRVRRLAAVELDAGLAAGLARRFSGPSGIEIVHADILKTDLDGLFPPAERPVKILGNLPYAITSPIFEKLLAWDGWTRGVFLIQREVADRMAAAPGSRRFGILSLAVQLFAEVERILVVKPGAFVPPPDVFSAVVRLTRRPAALLPPNEVAAFFDLAHAAFAHRRKTLANSLALFTRRPKAEVESWLQTQGISGEARAEQLSLSEYAQMAAPWAIFRRKTELT